MSLKDDIEKWGQPWTDMVRVTQEREPRSVLIADSGASEVLLSQVFALKEIGRGVAVHVTSTEDTPNLVMLHCLPWITREQLSSHVVFCKGSRLAIGRMIGGCDMLCLAADDPRFQEDVERYLPVVHQNGAIWVTGVSPHVPSPPIEYIQQFCKLLINDVDQHFRLFAKKHWTPMEPALDPPTQTC